MGAVKPVAAGCWLVAQAEDFDGAFERAYEGLAQVHFEGMQFRRDIGHQVRRQEP